jgi:hypothetical protein
MFTDFLVVNNENLHFLVFLVLVMLILIKYVSQPADVQQIAECGSVRSMGDLLA